jgi:hypothetical protein
MGGSFDNGGLRRRDLPNITFLERRKVGTRETGEGWSLLVHPQPTYLSGFAVLKCPVSKRPVSKQKDNEEIRYLLNKSAGSVVTMAA